MKKKHPWGWGIETPSLTKLLKMTRLTTIFLFACVTLAHAGGFLRDVKVTVSLKSAKLTTFFKAIEKETKYRFAYSDNIIPGGNIVTINAKEAPLTQVMDAVMKQANLQYSFDKQSGTLIISQLDQVPSTNTGEKLVRTITGTVVKESGEPLAGVSVVAKEKSKATTTDDKGFFSIDVDDEVKTLVFSFVGMATQEVNVQGKSSISVVLTSLNKSMNEVVVIGYGTQKRALVTGAVSSVSSKTLNELPAVNISQALQGRVAGLQVTNNGSPGTEPIVRIRGISSISFASDPLYVVDGFPTGNLSAIDVKDIESVDVLKDASAAAIYGSRATSGVIIINTKKGRRDGKININVDSYFGTQEVTKRLSLLNTEQFKQYALAYRGSQVPRLTAPQINEPIYAGATQTYGQTNTDWQEAYFRTGAMNQHNINLNGGNDVSRFYASAGYFNQEGTAPSVSYKRFNFRINSDHIINKVFTFGENLYIASGDQGYDNNETQSRTNLVNVIRMMPHIPVYDPTSIGGYRGVDATKDGGDPTNPVEDAELKNPGTRSTVKIFGTAFLEANITKWLKFKSTFGIDYANTLDYRFSPIFNDNGAVAGSSATQATITNNRNLSTVKLFTQQLTFDKTFGNHHINAIAVVEQQNQETKQENASGNQPSNDLRTLNNATNPSIQTLVGENSLLSYLGRVTYDYKGKYLLSAAVRHDGLSVWAPGKKWATFPSVSIGWRLDQEEFVKNVSAISELKLRAGYGVTGLNGLVLGNTPWLVNVAGNSSNYPFGNAVNGALGSNIPGLGNKELEWEKTNQINIGVDLGLFRNKLTFSAEYYNRETDNLLLQVPIPPGFGYLNNSVLQNIGGMINEGLEFQLGYNKREGDFKWYASTNMSFVSNLVTKLAPGVTNIEAGNDADFGGGNITNTSPANPVQGFYGWVTDGIFQSTDDVIKHATQVVDPGNDPLKQTSAGDIRFKDLNGDGKIDDNDRQYLGSYIPDVTYAFNFGANYKNFDVSLFFQGVQGNKIYNAARVITEGMVRFFNAGTQVLNAWTPTNKNTSIPRAVSSDPNRNARPSDRFLEDGSFLRLKNVMVGYTIPSQSLRSYTKGAVKSIRIYVSAQNLLTFTGYTGYDPEVGNRAPNANNGSLTSGIDFFVYPQPRSFQAGIQLGL